MQALTVNQCVCVTKGRDFKLDCKPWHGASLRNITCINFRVKHGDGEDQDWKGGGLRIQDSFSVVQDCFSTFG